MTREEAIQYMDGLRCEEDFPYTDIVADFVKERNEAIDMAIEALQEVQKHEETFEWCTDCKEYDKDNYCCHRWSKMIRNTVEELKEYSGLVRCKDCRWWSCKDSLNQHNSHLCRYWKSTNTSADDLCSYGERREP